MAAVVTVSGWESPFCESSIFLVAAASAATGCYCVAPNASFERSDSCLEPSDEVLLRFIFRERFVELLSRHFLFCSFEFNRLLHLRSSNMSPLTQQYWPKSDYVTAEITTDLLEDRHVPPCLQIRQSNFNILDVAMVECLPLHLATGSNSDLSGMFLFILVPSRFCRVITCTLVSVMVMKLNAASSKISKEKNGK